VQAHFCSGTTDARRKAILWQTLLEWHLTTLETGFHRATGPGLQALVSATRRLANTGADAATDALRVSLGTRSGLEAV
jgi:hypothetical protein